MRRCFPYPVPMQIKMKKISICLFIVFAFFVMSGCNKIPESDIEPAMYDLSFNIRAGQSPGGMKETPDCINENQTASYVEVTLLKQGDMTATTIRLDVFYINSQPFTNTIKLVPGTYVIQEFLMRNDNMTPGNFTDDPVIAAAVHEGAAYASLVTSWLTREFTITPFNKNVLEVELVCYEEANFSSFGFEYFSLDQTVIREQNFFGDLCIQNLNAYYNSPYSAVLGGNANLLLDLPAIFQVEVVRNGISIKTYNNNSVSGISQPLKVQYADRLGTSDNFEFRLSVMVLENNTFQYEYFHTWSLTDALKINTGTDGVVDFVLGNCSPDADLVIPYSGNENAAPIANNVNQSGIAHIGSSLTGTYLFYDGEGDPQGASVYKWYRADDASGTNEMIINSANGTTYALQLADLNKYVRFAVIPIALTGTVQGLEAMSTDFTGPVTAAEFTCGSTFTVNHIAGGVAPESKQVTYGTVAGIPGETDKCWITQNLGADHHASTINDASEPSAGWYWQFNRKQGYRHDGSQRSPNATWINNISENADWQAVNDACAILLGTGWRIPTKTEWSNTEDAGNWDNVTDPWNSDLIMHPAGNLKNYDGTLQGRGTEGFYWSSSKKSNGNSRFLFFGNSNSYVGEGDQSSGFSLRCIKGN